MFALMAPPMVALKSRLKLCAGVNPADAARVLRTVATEGRNVAAQAGAGGDAISRLRDGYLTWAEGVEGQLTSFTHDTETILMLQTPRYWQIRQMHAGTVRPYPLVTAEADYQCAALDRLAADLEARIARAASPPGHITVLDTHILLHFLPPNQIPWPDIVGHSPIRLVLPLRVIEELDTRKWARKDHLADRARSLLPQLEQRMQPDGAPGELRPDVTIEVPIEAGARYRPDDADHEILETCLELRQFGGGEMTLIANDSGIKLRAQSLGIRCVGLPEDYARDRT